MKKSITLIKEAKDIKYLLKSISFLEQFGFEIEGGLCSFDKYISQNLTLSPYNLALCLRKQILSEKLFSSEIKAINKYGPNLHEIKISFSFGLTKSFINIIIDSSLPFSQIYPFDFEPEDPIGYENITFSTSSFGKPITFDIIDIISLEF